MRGGVWMGKVLRYSAWGCPGRTAVAEVVLGQDAPGTARANADMSWDVR